MMNLHLKKSPRNFKGLKTRAVEKKWDEKKQKCKLRGWKNNFYRGDSGFRLFGVAFAGRSWSLRHPLSQLFVHRLSPREGLDLVELIFQLRSPRHCLLWSAEFGCPLRDPVTSSKNWSFFFCPLGVVGLTTWITSQGPHVALFTTHPALKTGLWKHATIRAAGIRARDWKERPVWMYYIRLMRMSDLFDGILLDFYFQVNLR